MNDPDDLLTRQEFCAAMQISRATLYRWIEAGMPTVGTGRNRRYDPEAIATWFQGEAEEDAPLAESPAPQPTLQPGRYRCLRCGFTASLQQPVLGPSLWCPHCQEDVAVAFCHALILHIIE